MGKYHDITKSNKARYALSADEKEVHNFIKYNWFDEELEPLFIQRATHSLVMQYISSYRLFDASEVALIKRGLHAEIMFYLKHYTLCARALEALRYRGNVLELETLGLL